MVVLMLVMLQLPGLTGATAVTIAVTMIAGYYGAALLLASDTTNRSRQLWCRAARGGDPQLMMFVLRIRAAAAEVGPAEAAAAQQEEEAAEFPQLHGARRGGESAGTSGQHLGGD